MKDYNNTLPILFATFLITISGCNPKSKETSASDSYLKDDSLFYDTAPMWSKSGDRILFYTYRHDSEGAELYTITPDAKELKRITNSYHNEWWSDFSSSDEQIYFSSDKGKSSRFGGSEIFSMNIDGSSIKQLTKSADTTLFNINPVVSPDGSKITYCHDCIGKETNSEIYLIKADGSEPINLTNHPANDRNPAWSPHGKKLLFSSDRSGNYELYILDISSSQLTQITHSPHNEIHGDWSVNDEIVFVSDEDGDMEIMTMNIDGSDQKQITRNIAKDVLPTWSPNGEKIAFSAYRRGKMDKGDIYVINRDGTNERLLTK